MPKIATSVSILQRYFPKYKAKFIANGCLLTPQNSQIFPREPLAIDRELILDSQGNPVNGIAPIDLSARQHAAILTNLTSDLLGADLDLQGKLRSILFLRPEPDHDNELFHVAEPCQATHFYLITSWDRDRGQNGISKKYARNHGLIHFCKHRPKSNKSGRDFLILPISVLSDDTVRYFEQLWQDAVSGH